MRLRTSILIPLLSLALSAQQPIYLDPSQPIDKRVDDLIPRLTLQEKGSLLCTTAPAIERLKIPVMNGWNQSLHGIVWTRPTTMFPVNISMAATWNPALVHDVASVIADEGRAIYNLWPTVSGKTEPGGQGQPVTVTADGQRLRHNGLVYRSPVINISRDPRWGRIHEAFGEDPYLTSRITVAYVRGTQGDDSKYLKLATTLKHYAVNNQERARTSRISGSGQVTVRVAVQNTGKRAGDEVVQLYVRDVEASVKRPSKELRGFERVSLKPGERKTDSFSLPAEKLAFWDTNKKAFVAEPGPFEVLVGSSSEEIRAKGQFIVSSPGQWPN